MSDPMFESLLAEFNQSYKDAEEFSNWMPDDGEYIVTVIKCAKGASEKEGKKTLWWKLTGRIEAPQDEKLNGQEFALGFYSNNAFGILKGQARALNGGDTAPTLTEANDIFTGAVGKILRVKVVTSTSTKNGQDYTNCFIQEVIATEDVTNETTAEAPPQ